MITELIPRHPGILRMTDPWELWKIKEFECKDLGTFDATIALFRAQKKWEEK